MIKFVDLQSKGRLVLLVAAVALLAMLGASSVAAAPASNGSTGSWQAWYWNNSDLSGAPVFYRTESWPAVDVGLGSPAPGVSNDFSALWLGAINVTSAGRYTFAARVDDGVRLWVDTNLVLNNWQVGAARVVANTVSLGAGQHTVRVEYFDAREIAVLELAWGPQGTVALAGEGATPATPTLPAPPVRPPLPAEQPLTIGDDFLGGGPLAFVGRPFSLNARTGPSVAYPVVTVLGGGTPVEMLYRWQAGLWVAVQSPTGIIGWVNATYLDADFATGNLPEWRGDPQALASPAPGGPDTQPPSTPSAPGGGPLATMTGAYVLNVRTGPAVNFAVVTTISRGATVEMLYRWGPGLWVAVRTADGAVGWVNATFLSADFATGNLPEWRSAPQAVVEMPG